MVEGGLESWDMVGQACSILLGYTFGFRSNDLLFSDTNVSVLHQYTEGIRTNRTPRLM